MEKYLMETELLNYNEQTIKALIKTKGWANKEDYEKLQGIYEFVRNEIAFGYNKQDNLKASEILKEGLGQCNTKSILLMALLRAVDIPCRIHGFYIDKTMQKGALVGIVYLLAPKKVTHAWTEAFLDGKWIALEGVIIDDKFYNCVQDKLEKRDNGYFGYAIAIKEKESPSICFAGKDTFVQSLSITDDLGLYDSPDAFFKEYNNHLNAIKQFLYDKVLRKRLNKRIEKMRK